MQIKIQIKYANIYIFNFVINKEIIINYEYSIIQSINLKISPWYLKYLCMWWNNTGQISRAWIQTLVENYREITNNCIIFLH